VSHPEKLEAKELHRHVHVRRRIDKYHHAPAGISPEDVWPDGIVIGPATRQIDARKNQFAAHPVIKEAASSSQFWSLEFS
jgi:hypothetical protein